MAQSRHGERVDIVIGNVVAAVEKRAHLGGGDDCLCGTGAGTVAQILLCRLDAEIVIGIGGRHEQHCVVHDVIGYGNILSNAAHGQKLLARAGGLSRLRHGLLGHVYDSFQLVNGGERNNQLEHKAVHLRLGQRVGTVLLNGVLGCQHEEGLIQLMAFTHNGNGMLLHRLEKCRLGFRRCTVNFVRQNDITENRTRLEGEGGVSVLVLDDNAGTRYVRRHQVGGELNTGKGQVKHATKRTHKTRFTKSGRTLKKHVTARDNRENGKLHYLVLTDDVLTDLSKNLFALFCKHCKTFFVDYFCHGMFLRFSFAIFKVFICENYLLNFCLISS